MSALTADSVGGVITSKNVSADALQVGAGELRASLRGSPARPLTISKISVQGVAKRALNLSGEKWHTRDFRLFAQRYELSVFRYMGVDWLGEIRTCCNNLSPRWSSYHQRRTLARVYSWAESAAMENAYAGTPLAVAHLVTLTVRHDTSGSFRSHRETVEKLRQGWAAVRCWVSRSGVRFLRVIEPGERRGYAHIHMVIIGASDAWCEALVRRWLAACPDASPRGQNIQRVEDVRRVGAYVAKYLSKSVERRDSPEYWRWMELCYRLRLRCFSMDAASSNYIKRKYGNKPAGVGVCELEFNAGLIKPESGITGEDAGKSSEEGASQGEHPLPEDAPAHVRGRSVLSPRDKGSDRGCSPTPHRSGGRGGLAIPHDVP